MYYDLHLQFKDEAEANSVLFTPQYYTEDGEDKVRLMPKYAAVDVIGVIYAKPIEAVEDEVVQPVHLYGWHVNVRHTEEMPELTKYAIQVDNPVRVWA